MTQTVLVVEDEKTIQDLLHLTLTEAQFQVMMASDIDEAQSLLAKKIPDLVVLDWMLPKNSGIGLIKKLKANESWRNIPIIMATAKAEEYNKISALELGADDYITKPFSPRELVARVKAILRRGIVVDPQGVVRIKNLNIRVANRAVTVDETPLKLSPIEYRLLHFFVTHPGKVFSRLQILEQVWNGDADISDRTIDVHLRRLRNKLKEYQLGDLIKTIYGVGYQLEEVK